jgi:hypothetical protein
MISIGKVWDYLTIKFEGKKCSATSLTTRLSLSSSSSLLSVFTCEASKNIETATLNVSFLNENQSNKRSQNTRRKKRPLCFGKEKSEEQRAQEECVNLIVGPHGDNNNHHHKPDQQHACLARVSYQEDDLIKHHRQCQFGQGQVPHGSDAQSATLQYARRKSFALNRKQFVQNSTSKLLKRILLF